MERTYKTRNVDQAAVIMTVTGVDPLIRLNETGLATFIFPVNADVTNVVLQYETAINVDARALLNNRNQLFKRIRGGRHE